MEDAVVTRFQNRTPDCKWWWRAVQLWSSTVTTSPGVYLRAHPFHYLPQHNNLVVQLINTLTHHLAASAPRLLIATIIAASSDNGVTNRPPVSVTEGTGLRQIVADRPLCRQADQAILTGLFLLFARLVKVCFGFTIPTPTCR